MQPVQKKYFYFENKALAVNSLYLSLNFNNKNK